MNFITADNHTLHGNIIKHARRDCFLSQEDREVLERNNGTWDGIEYKVSQAAVEMMDETIIQSTNAMVGEPDTLWILGDFVYGTKNSNYYSICKQFRDQIKCKDVRLVWGNHDKPSIANLFSWTGDIAYTTINDQLIVMCHYAMAVWKAKHYGSIHLYGHSHAGSEEWLDKVMPERRSMDVGVDMAYKMFGVFRPFCVETEIIPMMLRKSGHGPIKHR